MARSTSSQHNELARNNEPRLLILMSLAGGSKHGYALTKDIAEFAGVTLGPGALYGAITRLEEQGFIHALPEVDRRRPYEISVAGRQALESAVLQLRRLADVGRQRLDGRVRRVHVPRVGLTGSPT